MFTKKQIAALKYVIFEAKNVSNLSKQISAFLIDRSKKLTKDVCLTLVENREGYTAKEINAAVNGIGWMASSSGATHLDQIIIAMGSEFRFAVHYGDFNPRRKGDPFNNAGQFAGVDASKVMDLELTREGMPLRYTFWLSGKYYSRQSKLVIANRQKLEQIDITKPGLYPMIESQNNAK